MFPAGPRWTVTSMERLRVVVRAADAIAHAGVTSYLRSRAQISVVPASHLGTAHVLVVVADAVTAEIIAMLRQVAAESATRTVLVTDQLAETDLLTAVECRVVAVLSRAAVTGDRLVNAVIGAAEGCGVLPSDLLGALLSQ